MLRCLQNVLLVQIIAFEVPTVQLYTYTIGIVLFKCILLEYYVSQGCFIRQVNMQFQFYTDWIVQYNSLSCIFKAIFDVFMHERLKNGCVI